MQSAYARLPRRQRSVRSRPFGFTLLEITIAMAVLSVLVTMAAPVLKLQAQRQKEGELRHALREVRTAIDGYRQAVRDGKVRLPADASGYPASLELLVDGVADASRTDGARLHFLRRIPRDPMRGSPPAGEERSAASPWGLRSYQSPATDPQPGADVFDVHSLSTGTGLNGVPYRDW